LADFRLLFLFRLCSGTAPFIFSPGPHKLPFPDLRFLLPNVCFSLMAFNVMQLPEGDGFGAFHFYKEQILIEARQFN
jgi:hypothetical protein